MPVFSTVVSKAIVVTAIMAALWFGAVQRPAAQTANGPLLVTRLQQLAVVLQHPPTEQAQVLLHWQAAELAWQQQFERAPSAQLNRRYNQLQVNYQLYVQDGDSAAFGASVQATLSQVMQHDEGGRRELDGIQLAASSLGGLHSGWPRQLKGR